MPKKQSKIRSDTTHCTFPRSDLWQWARPPFRNSLELSSLLGYIMILTDDSRPGNIILYASYKSKRDVRSVLGAESYVFAAFFNRVYTTQDELLRIMRRGISLVMQIDSACLFNNIIWCCKTSDRRSMINMAVTRDAYDKKEIYYTGCISTTDNMADAFNKQRNNSLLENFMDAGYFEHALSQW